jgi:hypothetical protein
MTNSGASKPRADTCYIKCTGKKTKSGKSWTSCDYEQFCAKLKEAQARGGSRYRRSESALKRRRRKQGNRYAARFRKNWNRETGEGTRSARASRGKFYAKCAYDEAKKGTDVRNFSPDHMQEIQVRGAPALASNIKWLKSYVNESVGSHLRKFRPPKHTKISATCCPA